MISNSQYKEQRAREKEMLNSMWFYTVDDVSDMMKFSKHKTYQLFNSSGFPAIRIGHDLRVEKSRFEKWATEYAGREYLL